jgi:predicted DNA-binding transcriptional regulator YafY
MLDIDDAALLQPDFELRFSYTNYRGEVSLRRVRPISVWVGLTAWHPSEQRFLKALDLDKNEVRDFALTDAFPA